MVTGCDLQVDVTDFVRPVCLPEAGRLPTPDSYCYISGWGHMGNRSELTHTHTHHRTGAPGESGSCMGACLKGQRAEPSDVTCFTFHHSESCQILMSLCPPVPLSLCPVPFKLQEGPVRLMSMSQCQSYFDMKTITPRMLCAGYDAGTVDSCMVTSSSGCPASVDMCGHVCVDVDAAGVRVSRGTAAVRWCVRTGDAGRCWA